MSVGRPYRPREPGPLTVIKFDLFTGVYDITPLLDRMSQDRKFSGVKFVDLNGDDTDMKKPTQVMFTSTLREWKEWEQVVLYVSNLVNQCSKDGVALVTGKTPLSVFTLLGMYIHRSIPMANEFRNEWKLYIHEDINRDVGLLKLTMEPPRLQKDRVDRMNTYALVFVTLNGTYSVSEEQRNAIQDLIPEKECIGPCFRIGPDPELVRGVIELQGDPSCESYNYHIIANDIENSLAMIFYEHKTTFNGMILACTGPSPVAYILGSVYKLNVYGRYVMVELVQGNYQKSFESEPL
ncbi:MAG: hypothetical protein JSS82_07835 [Bacteroidetes bacterium]|nr:hypothetical protein [Bacteroidota bacterium]